MCLGHLINDLVTETGGVYGVFFFVRFYNTHAYATDGYSKTDYYYYYSYDRRVTF